MRGCFYVLNVHTFSEFRENIFVNSFSIHPETICAKLLMPKIHFQCPLFQSWTEHCHHVFVFSFSEFSQHLVIVCFRNQLHLTWDDEYLYPCLILGLSEEHKPLSESYTSSQNLEYYLTHSRLLLFIFAK